MHHDNALNNKVNGMPETIFSQFKLYAWAYVHIMTPHP